MNLPDLRKYDGTVSIEHVSVLQERLGRILEEAYPGEDLNRITNTFMDPDQMLEDMLTLFDSAAFLTMFQTEFGKGVIIGAFVQKFIFGGEA